MVSGQVGFQTRILIGCWAKCRGPIGRSGRPIRNLYQFEILSALATYPNPGQRVNQLYGASAVSLNDYFIVFGGFSYPKILATVNKYENGKWIQLKGTLRTLILAYFWIVLDLLLPRHGHRSVAIAPSESQPIKSQQIYHIGGAHEGLDQNRPSLMPYELWQFTDGDFSNSTLSKNGLDRFYYWPESFLQIQ